MLALFARTMLIGVPERPPIVKVLEVTLESKTTLVAVMTFVTLIELRASASECLSRIAPSMTVVAPVKVLAALRVSVPRPILVRPPARPSRLPPVAARLPSEPRSSTLLPLVSNTEVPNMVRPPPMAPGPEVMSTGVSWPADQRMVPPRTVRPPPLAP